MNNSRPLFANLERCIMSPLQEQVLAKGICPACHKSTLTSGYAGGNMQMLHCSCGHTWVIARAA